MDKSTNNQDAESALNITSPSLLGMVVRQLRTHHNMTPADLARRANVAESVVSRLENGQTRSLHGHNLESIAEALNVKPSYLKGLAYAMPPASPEEVWSKYMPGKDFSTAQVPVPNVEMVTVQEAQDALVHVMARTDDQRVREQALVLYSQGKRAA